MNIGFVVIGRNEGVRLKNCLSSLPSDNKQVIYVDSGSTDGSVEFVQKQGLYVLDLDLSKPFTAARARNQGWTKLLELWPHVEYIHFIDGDCQLHPDWLPQAIEFLDTNASYAIVCGQRKELHPEQSIYNQICDIEWNTPIGDAKSCGGDFIIRAEALIHSNGFRDDFIAGEEPELCFRLRQLGYKIYRLAPIMSLHDADIHHFSQWWRRSKRAGYAYLLGAFTHGKSAEKYRVKESLRALAWGFALPIAGLIATAVQPFFFILLVLAYAYLFLKIYLRLDGKAMPRHIQAGFLILSKFAESAGALQFANDRWLRKKYSLIEYK